MLGDERVSDAYAKNAEFWITIVRDKLDPYQTLLTDPALLDFIGDCEGLSVLDAGCGEGYLTRELIRRGADHVAGVDTCREFVDAAIGHPEHQPGRASFHHADVADLPLAEDSVDLVVVNRLPNGIDQPETRFREFARVLKRSGRLILLGMHPCFYAARAERTAAGSDDFSIDDYFGVRTVEQRFNVEGKVSPAASVQQFYSLEAYIQMITSAGFVIADLREPHPTVEQRRQNPWWDQNFRRPLFLMLECIPNN
ncbi:ubiquinone/menaquinone biosynthesis C-methylase UbiE [Nocardia tenerifensis]|uniref:Ubiquinone/menaquinone biosynthesis C-methylase UbiE n=1 Tax=Nocardia tenerifensis TaxID=228006 RepID=A0A318K5W4_9NOCA|nr:class I SAM-dependent methyltransferase [Nocardia tenerifensis]PXX58488.1 ubiquinone/menaquinone biosynthesis C-methylase UbiE [Nocardia tenerifensis]